MVNVCKLVALKPTNLSRAMHNAAFEELGLDFRYEVLDTDDTALAIDQMRADGLRGYSLTIPHKESVLPLLDSISEDCKKIGAVNTVINSEGRLSGFNTDWYGIAKALEETGRDFAGQSALVLGAGGAARAAVYSLQELNFKTVYVANRNSDRAKQLGSDFSVLAGGIDDLEGVDLENYSVLINSTPLGSHLADGGEELFDSLLKKFSEDSVVFDMVTKNTTALLDKASAKGQTTISGLRMLLHQAVEQNRHFTESYRNPGNEIPIEVMEKALYEEASKN